jgi:1-acyl-sn-glycerol-3-phosphate acyltransferase
MLWPTASELDDLAARFRARSLPAAEWTHVAHLAIGAWHVRRYGADGALRRLRSGIRRLNEAHGTPNSDTRGYHETVTRAYVELIAAFLAKRPRDEAPDASVRALLASPLAGKDALLAFYSRDRLLSTAARRRWTEPDLHPLSVAPAALAAVPKGGVESIDFTPLPMDDVLRLTEPLRRLFSPVALGTENVPRTGPVLIAGNHTVYGLLDIPMLGLALYEKTGRLVRGLGDHTHFALPVWRDFLHRLGGVRGTRENCARLFQRGEAVLVFPGGGREVMKRKGEKYALIWKERVGFVRLAIEHGVPIVPLASVGVEEMFEIVADAEDLLRSPVGDLLRAIGVTRKAWFRGGEIIPPIARGTGPAGLPRFERQYFLLGRPIDTTRYAGRHTDAEACLALRQEVRAAIEGGIAQLRAVQAADPERYPVQRWLRQLASRLG